MNSSKKMIQPKLLNLLALAITTLCLIAIPLQSQAASKGKAKAEQPSKEKVILMPMDIPAENRNMFSEMQDTVVQGLKQKYQVFSGEQVLAELKKAADKQNKSTKKNCDEKKCLQDVAMAFGNAYVAMVHLTKMEGGYALSISIVDVMTNESIYSNPLTCKGCDSFQLLDKLKELVGAPEPVASAPTVEEPQSRVRNKVEMPVKVDSKDTNARPVKVVAPVKKDSLATLLGKADALMKSGKPAEAYNLLEPEEGEYSGELGYDYLLGISALDSGKPDRATIAFERVLIVNPNFAGARVDLGRAYFTMGSDDLAKQEFETVLTQSPPPQVAKVVQKFLADIAEREKAKIQQVTYYLENSAGYDDNITAATPDPIGGVAGYLGVLRSVMEAAGYKPTGSSLRYRGIYESVSGGTDVTRKINEDNGMNLFAGADVKKRFYNTLSEMNNENLDLRGGVSLAKSEDTYRLTATYSKYLQAGFIPDSNNNRNTAGINAEWKRSINERNQMTWSLLYSQPRYLMSPTQDTNQVSLSASLLHIFEGEMTPLVFVNLSRSSDHALRSLSSGSNMSRTGTSLMLHSQVSPTADMDLFLSGGLSLRHDDSPNARSSLLTDFYAQDLTQNWSTGVTARLWPKWVIKGTIAWTKNHSNLDLYNYQKMDSSISLRRDF